LEQKKVILEARNITKRFPGVKALSDVSLQLREGEVLALLGENGAGKSTLIKILSGVFNSDEGEIYVAGEKVEFHKPSDATKKGISIIHQELNYVGTISVAENIFMGNIPKKGLAIDYPRMYEEATKILGRIDVEINPRVIIGKLTVAQKQLIEIAKVVTDQTKVLIMDEPTSALNDVETENLIKFVHNVSERGIAIIYISHRFDEIFRIADSVVVLRDGHNVGGMDIKDASREKFITMMAGRSIADTYNKKQANPGEVILEVDHLSTAQIKEVTFRARRGEITGVYGLLGSGHNDLGPAIFGQERVIAGHIKIEGKEIKLDVPITAIKNGMAYVPAERKTEGLILNSSIKINMTTAYYSKFNKKKLIDLAIDNAIAKKWIGKFSIKTPNAEAKAESLSGGNQQKVVLSKWLELNPKILILNEPTRGIDVGSKIEIYKILDELCQQGLCVIMITSEMEELLTMSHRVMVMHDGLVIADISGDQITQDNIIKYAMGEKNEREE
jgi:ABC-type sugar transport system ATPase subunit